MKTRFSLASRANALPLCLALAAGCSAKETSPAAPEVASNSDAVTPDEATLTQKQLLGKRLFEDNSLSEPAGESCASCHDGTLAFAGNHQSPIAGVSRGSEPGVFGNRNTPSAMYASFVPHFHIDSETDEDGNVEYLPTGGQFWDGRADGLNDQAQGPLLNPREMNNPDEATVIDKVDAASYVALYRQVFGSRPTDDARAFEHVTEAIAAFEESERFHPFSSKFDDFLRGKQELDAQEARGFELFKDPEKGNCIACHVGDENSRDPQDWLFTDFTFDNLGIPRNQELPDNADPNYFDLGLCERPGIESQLPEELPVRDLCGAFRVPTLRNVALTAPYAHNGVFTTLEDVVRFYVTRDTNPELWYSRTANGELVEFDDLPEDYRDNVNTDEPPYDRKPGEPPRLDDEEIAAVVAFLKTLSDG